MGEATIIRQHHRTKFTALSNDMIQDESLSWAETGMMTYLLSLPDGWHVRTDDLVKRKSNGRDAVRSLQASLARKGYLKIDRYRDSSNRWRRTVHVFEEPLNMQDADLLLNQELQGSSFPVPGNPARETRHGKPGTGNPARKPRAHSKDSEAKTQLPMTESKDTTTAAAEDVVLLEEDVSLMTNKFDGLCVKCGCVVEARTGKLIGNKPSHLPGQCAATVTGKSKYAIADHQEEGAWL